MDEDCTMIIQFKHLKPSRENLQTFKDIKNELIGNEKQSYFDNGLIETIIPLLTVKIDESETSLDDPLILYECLAILNSFLIQFKKSNDVFSVFKADI